VFLQARAPHRGLTTAGVPPGGMRQGQRAETGHVRAHRLPHSAATGMLGAAAQLTEIGPVHTRAADSLLKGTPPDRPATAGSYPRFACSPDIRAQRLITSQAARSVHVNAIDEY
jgi:hypothetical protein